MPALSAFGRSTRERAWSALALMLAVAVLFSWTYSALQAQETKDQADPTAKKADGGAATEKPDASEGDPATPAAPAAPAPNTAEAAPAAGSAPGDKKPMEQQNMLWWIIKSSGWIGALIFLESFLLVGLTVQYLLLFRERNYVPAEFIDQFEEHLKAKSYQDAYELARTNESLLARVLSSGLAKLGTGASYPQAIEAMQEVGEGANLEMEHKVSYLSLIAQTGPLFGLVGTVAGMIRSFRVIATSETQPKPSLLAEGISESLFCTLEGLMVAIGALIAFVLLRNKAARLIVEVGIVSERLMSRFSSVGKKSTADAST